MDTVIAVMSIFLAKALCLNWSTFILLKKIKRLSSLCDLSCLFSAVSLGDKKGF